MNLKLAEEWKATLDAEEMIHCARPCGISITQIRQIQADALRYVANSFDLKSSYQGILLREANQLDPRPKA